MSRLRLVLIAVLPLLSLSDATLTAQGGPSRGRAELSLVDELELLRRRSGDAVVPDRREIERLWSDFESLPETLPSVRRTPALRASFDRALLRRAISRYRAAGSVARHRLVFLRSVEERRRNLPGGPWWQKVDLGAALDRLARRGERPLRRKLAEDYAAVLDTLGEISDTKLRESPLAVSLRQAALRELAIHRFALREPIAALRALDRYRRNPNTEREWPLHYYLAAAYDAIFRSARLDRGLSEDRLRRLRRRKNVHLLRAVELRYGLESHQYGEVWKRVRLEELGGPRSD